MLLGLLLVAFTAAMAQTSAQGDQKKKTEACCSMDSCCCNDGSCEMKEQGEGTASTDAKESCCGDSCRMKTTDMKNHSDDHECCAGCGDSCDMDMKHEANMKHDATMQHDMKKHGDCCNMKHKDMKAKVKKSA
jgi:hypothetical protein